MILLMFGDNMGEWIDVVDKWMFIRKMSTDLLFTPFLK